MNIHLQGLYGGKHEDGIKRFATHFPTFQTTPKVVYPLKTKINPTDMTSNTHLNLPNVSLSAAPSTHTTMPAIEWLRLRELSGRENGQSESARRGSHHAHSDYFREAVKSWRGVRPLFHKSQSFPPDISDYWMKPNAHSETYWDEELMANHVPMLNTQILILKQNLKR